MRVASYYLLAAVVCVTFICGCEPPKQLSFKKCPGKDSLEQAVAALREGSAQPGPFMAYGKGVVQFYDADNDKIKKESISGVKIWFDPPQRFRFWGDVVFDQRGIDLGSNEKEFWLAARPKEIGNIYIWGLWSQQDDASELLFSPRILRQAFGFIEIDNAKDWTMKKLEYYDILTERNAQGNILRRIYIDNCGYNVRTIEYFDANEKIVSVLKLDDYKTADSNMPMPYKIEVTKIGDDGTADSFEITLKSIKPQEKIKDAIFAKPSTKRFKEVFKLVKGKAVQQ